MANKSCSSSSKRWLIEHFSDKYVQQAHKNRLRSRAWFKLIEIQKKDKVFKPGMTVIDLGSSPGGWSQSALSQVGKTGRVIACDVLPMYPITGVDFIQGDFCDESFLKKFLEYVSNSKVQVIMSDMSPNICGIPIVDISRTVQLVELALKLCLNILELGGSFIVKIFQGEGFKECLEKIYFLFKKVTIRKPNSSRASSRELYIVATRYKS